ISLRLAMTTEGGLAKGWSSCAERYSRRRECALLHIGCHQPGASERGPSGYEDARNDILICSCRCASRASNPYPNESRCTFPEHQHEYVQCIKRRLDTFWPTDGDGA